MYVNEDEWGGRTTIVDPLSPFQMQLCLGRWASLGPYQLFSRTLVVSPNPRAIHNHAFASVPNASQLQHQQLSC